MDDALTDVIPQLYGVPPEEFVAARAAAVAQARKDGDRTRAGAVGKLRKPTVAAWLVNLLAHQRPDLVAELLALGEEMRRAQRGLAGAELKELSVRRREVVGQLTRQARALAVAAGRGARDPLPLAEVEATLTVALADEAVAEEIRAGRLTRAVEYGGFGELPRPPLRLVQGAERAPAAPVPATPVPADEEADADGAASAPADADDAIGERADQERAAADRADRERADRERAAADRAAAEQQATERAEAVRQRTARAAAHRELLAARTALAEAETARAAAERAVLAARRRVEAAMARATGLDGEHIQS
ncbi:MAG TPA: hypothetical protein VK453_19795 [Micromonosporaceae bacterium]|nr:hypothetical protein [Micromonosporaceae bacterium]